MRNYHFTISYAFFFFDARSFLTCISRIKQSHIIISVNQHTYDVMHHDDLNILTTTCSLLPREGDIPQREWFSKTTHMCGENLM